MTTSVATQTRDRSDFATASERSSQTQVQSDTIGTQSILKHTEVASSALVSSLKWLFEHTLQKVQRYNDVGNSHNVGVAVRQAWSDMKIIDHRHGWMLT